MHYEYYYTTMQIADCKVQYYWLRRRAIICGKSFDCIKRREGGETGNGFLEKNK